MRARSAASRPEEKMDSDLTPCTPSGLPDFSVGIGPQAASTAEIAASNARVESESASPASMTAMDAGCTLIAALAALPASSSISNIVRLALTATATARVAFSFGRSTVRKNPVSSCCGFTSGRFLESTVLARRSEYGASGESASPSHSFPIARLSRATVRLASASGTKTIAAPCSSRLLASVPRTISIPVSNRGSSSPDCARMVDNAASCRPERSADAAKHVHHDRLLKYS